MFIACAALIALIALTAAIAASPLVRTLSVVMDAWADGVHGDTDRLR